MADINSNTDEQVSPPIRRSSIPAQPRAKRAKYAVKACEECKKRKLKCNRVSSQHVCQRCEESGTQCTYDTTAASWLWPVPAGELQSMEQMPRNFNDATELKSLREQVTLLTDLVEDLSQKIGQPSSVATSATSSAVTSPRELTSESPRPRSDSLLSMPLAGVTRLLNVFQEEVESIYPFIRTERLFTHTERVINKLRRHAEGYASLNIRDRSVVRLIKVAIASAIVIEPQGKNELSDMLVDSVGPEVNDVSRSSVVELGDLQLLTMMSIYYFHCEEALLAWRTIGTAARMAHEIGLHRKHDVMENYTSLESQSEILNVFWCIYVLDRSWSLGTGLPFALGDRDIHPELPEPTEDFQYLRCQIGYVRLCSQVREAFPQYGPPATAIPKDQVQYLDLLIQSWLYAIPENLQLQHPRLGLASQSQLQMLRRLSTLLYLQGSHLRTLLYRHHVLSSAAIHSDTQASRLVVDIAKDSIDVLVDLAETSDIYRQQQATFNPLLVSAMAVVLLAVCHAPELFSEPCGGIFSASVQLVRGFSRQGHASKRLWKSIQGLLPIVKSLDLTTRADTSLPVRRITTPRIRSLGHEYEEVEAQMLPPAAPDRSSQPVVVEGIGQSEPDDPLPYENTAIPDTSKMSNELMQLFDMFRQTGRNQGIDPNQSRLFEYTVEVSRRLQDLI